MLTEMFTKVNGRMTKRMAMASTCTSREQPTEGTGHMTSKKDEVWSSGLMVPGTMESIRTTRSMGLALFHGLTVLHMKESFRRTTSKGRALTSGLTTGSTLAIGTTTRCTARASSVGVTGEHITDNTLMIRRVGEVLSDGLMAGSITDNGTTVSNTAMVSTLMPMATSKSASGKLDEGNDGSMTGKRETS